jgi:hypothetical protein
VCGIFFDLGAKPINMRIDSVFVPVMPVPPHSVQQLGSRVNFSGIARKMQQQVKFLGRKINGAACDVSTSFYRINNQVSGPNDGRQILFGPIR